MNVHDIIYLLEHRDDVAMIDDHVYELQCLLQHKAAEIKHAITPIQSGATKLQSIVRYRSDCPVRFVLPHQLDRTQCDDVYDYVSWKNWHENKGNTQARYAKFPRNNHNLSSARELAVEVVGRNVLCSTGRPFGIIPEISAHGARRCIVVNKNGRRCTHYTHDGIICHNHKHYKPYLKGYLMTNGGIYSGMFKNSSIRELYEDFKNSDARDITSEIALMRTMLGSALRALPAEVDAEKLPIEYVTHVLKMTNTITSAIEKYDRMQQRLGLLVTPEQLTNILMQILGIIRKTLDLKAEQYEQLAAQMETLSIERTVTDYSLVEGNPVAKYGDEDTPIKVKHSNRCTRYSEDGTIRQVPKQAELDYHEEKQDYLEATRGFERRTLYYKEGDHEPITTVNDREVEIGDPYDPYDTSKL